MDYCYKHGLPSAQKWAWDRAEEEWFKHLQIEKEMIDENRKWKLLKALKNLLKT